MIFEYWLDQSIPLIFALLAVLLFGTALVVFGLLASRWSRSWSGRFGGVVAPFFSAVSVLFALLTGFAANDAWDRNRQATRAILSERDGLVAIHELSIATVSDMSTIRTAVREYLDAVLVDEWPRLRDGESSPRAAESLSRLLAELADPKITTEAGLAAHQNLLALWQKVRIARSDRLALSEQNSDHPKWWTILLLAILTQVAIGVVHVDKPRAAAVALTLFTAAAIVTLSLIAVKERPFDGPLATPPTALRDAMAAMRAAAPAPLQAPAPETGRL